MIIILLIAIVLALGILKLMGMRAMAWRSIEVSGLTAEQIADVGTKASESMLRRMRGRAKVYPLPNGSLAWYAKNGGGVLAFVVTPLENGTGHRVDGRAEEIKVAQQRIIADTYSDSRGNTYIDLSSDYNKAKVIVNWIFWKMGIPANARSLLMRRRKTLNAIERAARRVPVSAGPTPTP
jgi:hypothetical protein